MLIDIKTYSAECRHITVLISHNIGLSSSLYVCYYLFQASEVILETKVLMSRHLQDKNEVLVLKQKFWSS